MARMDYSNDEADPLIRAANGGSLLVTSRAVATCPRRGTQGRKLAPNATSSVFLCTMKHARLHAMCKESIMRLAH